MATVISGDNVNVPGQIVVGTAPTLANHAMRLSDATGAYNGIIVAVDPVAAPTNGIPIRWNSVGNTLWFWDGANWILFG